MITALVVAYPVPATADPVPLSVTLPPANQAELAEEVRRAAASGTPVYPIGGGTSLGFGLPAKRPGIGLSLCNLTRVIEYPARDMTITVEAGITMAALAKTLSAERQRFPIDAPRSDLATLGGVVATNTSGPRRYGCGTVRDYVIGITAVDGRGTPFKGGGRVVKNVAGYDFCKLLVGSLGTIGIITQLTLKLKPQPEASALLACNVPDWNAAETLLAALVTSHTAPVAIELLTGPAWEQSLGGGPPGVAKLVVGLEGTAVEVDWMLGRLKEEWRGLGAEQTRLFRDVNAAALWSELTEFPVISEGLTCKAAVKPSSVVGFIEQLLAIDPTASIQAHAGNGIVVFHSSGIKPADAARTIIRQLQPAAAAGGGSLIVLSAPEGCELTRQSVWGGAGEDAALMRAVKDQFDPHGILNPGRFVYGR